jgi:flagellar M-ring protein FliF
MAVENIRAVWAGLDLWRRIALVGVTLAVFAGVLGMTRMGGNDTALLYAGLDPAAAGEVLAALEQRGIAAQVRGDAIFVPAAERDSLRLSLAAEGMPAGSAKGYEILDSLSGFGTTAQMFDAAYWRAKEGELARTILSVPGVAAARVHISTPPNRPFQRDLRPTAAVTVTMRTGRLDTRQAVALRHLVAAAVAGLDPADVAIIDSQGGLLRAEDAAGDADTRAEALRLRALRLLEARVGPGNAVVELTIETVTESESIVERRIDPQGRVAISTEVEERSSTSLDSGAAPVTVASNLPDGDAAGTNGESRSEDSETRSVTNYEVSELNREVLRAPGAVRRLSVAVLVNDIPTVAADGTVASTPRPEEEVAALRDLVASAVGLDAARGDIITIRSMPFGTIAPQGTEVIAQTGQPLDIMALLRLAVIAAVVIVLGLFVVRPVLLGRRGGASGAEAGAALPPPAALAAPGTLATPLAEAPLDSLIEDLGPIPEAETVDPVTRLRRLIDARQEDTVRILQSWIEDGNRKESA